MHDARSSLRSRCRTGVGRALIALSLAVACKADPPAARNTTPSRAASRGSIAPIEAVTGLDPQRVALGRRLFHEPRLSEGGSISCASCHDLSAAGADRLPRSLGHTGEPGLANSPSVFNASLNFRQFWDGRASTLEDQVNDPLLGALEMGSSWAKVLAVLDADRDYARSFREAYSGGPSETTVRDAIATFERSLTTPDSSFDRYLLGDAAAIGSDARRGYELFTTYGCVACHQGQGIGGNMFQKLGVLMDYFVDGRDHGAVDLGRFNVTHAEADRHVFKVPSLRNVARTAPYFHDGSVGTLEEAVRVMARYQLGLELEAQDAAALVAFLESLTGAYQGRSL